MTRWLDKPSLDSDELFDRFIETSQHFFKRYFSLIAKLGVPLLGFAIFLSYFIQHRFYPTFDLFQFSSLLLAASVISLVLVGGSAAFLLASGAMMHYAFINLPAIKEELSYIRPANEQQLGHFVLKILLLIYVLPFASSALAVTYLTLNHASFVSALFITPVLITLLAGLIVQKSFELKPFSFLRFIWAAYFPTVLIAFFSILVILDAAVRIDSIDSELLKTAIVYLVPLLISLIASLCAACFIGGWNVALHFCVFFGLGIAFYSGALTVLPDRTVNKLGLGHYQAEQILLEQAYCDTHAQQMLALSKDCSLKDVHVVWLMGDTLSFKSSKDSAQLLQIPTRFVKAVVKAVEP